MKGLIDQDALMVAAQNAAAQAEAMEIATQDGADKPMSLRTRAGAFGCKVMGYAGIGMAAMGAFPQAAFSATTLPQSNEKEHFINLRHTSRGSRLRPEHRHHPAPRGNHRSQR